MVIAFEVAGFVMLAVAALMFNLITGVACTGVLLLVLGYLIDAAGVRPRLPRPRLRRRKVDQ